MTLARLTIFFAAEPGMLTLILVLISSVFVLAQDKTPAADTIVKPINPYYPSFHLQKKYGDPFSNYTTGSPLSFKNLGNAQPQITLDTGMNYMVGEPINSISGNPTTSMSFLEFDAYRTKKMRKTYWKQLGKSLDDENSPVSNRTRGLIPKIYIGPVLDRIFGGSYVELIPRGFVTLDFGGSWQRIENPSMPVRQQNSGGFEFDQQINLSVVGKVGEKLSITTNFDNNNSFDFQNNMKVEYTGFKEDVLKKLEVGNVSLPLNNSLISGSQNLFGIKTQLQFGKFFVTAVATTQRGKQTTVETRSGSGGTEQGSSFEILGSNYDENRHFFLGHFFRDNYESWLSTLPQITSGINITRMEVYVLNRQNNTQTLRNVVGLMDMGESDKIYKKDIIASASSTSIPTDNTANTLFELLQTVPANADGINNALESLGLVNGTDFEKITSARKLTDSEFTFNKELGYITLQRKLQNDEALAVAFEYTYNGRRYKVGELTEDYFDKTGDDVIYLKLLRPRKVSIKDGRGEIIPTWDLMMKNMYNLNASQLSRDGFQLRVIYRDDRTGIDNPQLQDGDIARTKQLIEVFGLDRLNPYNDPQPDGNFDFVENITIDPKTGLIIFPFLHPFDGALKKLFAQENDPQKRDFLIQKYVYDTLYRTTKAEAQLITTKNKFYIVGYFNAGSGKEIMIQGFNITKGSVKVYAGGLLLQEGVDYSVDYNFGKVTILNEGILNSGKQIKVTYEQQDPFSFQTRTLLGTRFDYRFNDHINIGSTLLYYNERPLISRNLIGSEPARNIKYGLDLNIKKDSRLLTKIIDKFPFLQTKAKSSINFNAEFAQLIPGTSNIISGEGTSFIDDFENSATPYSLLSPRRWKLSTVPKTLDNRFDLSGGLLDDVKAGYKRAKIAWYQIDNQFYVSGASSLKPANISDKDLQNHYVRPIAPVEIFPFFDAFVGNFNQPILNLAYYPAERGPYNFNPDLNLNGTLKNPAANWGGITTAVRTEVDFDKANIEYLEFWLMDPFINSDQGRIIDSDGNNQSNTTGGKLVFQLGSLSEDLMRDGVHAFENGLPSDGNLTGNQTRENNWGYVTTQQYINNAFDNSSASRANQDVGLDGVDDEKEIEKFSAFINNVNPTARQIVLNDPSADNFQYFFGATLDNKDAKILERYKNFSGLENNSPIISGNDLFTRSGSNIPDNEDLNQDNTLSDVEEYYAYHINLTPANMAVGKKYIVDQVTNEINGDRVSWYLFRIPVRQFDEKIGDINGFKSIRYVRMYLTEFIQPVVLRMAKFRLVGSQWRRYTDNGEELQETQPDDFSVSVVNVEENGKSNSEKPAYVPPLQRDRDVTSTVQRRLNEQAVQICATDLPDGETRSIFKNVSMDFFNYGRIKMFLSVHGQGIENDQLIGFVRLGTDFDENYYEIELPLKITPPGANSIETVWPMDNQIDLNLNELYALKARRDRENFPLDEAFPKIASKQVGRHGIRIYGRPDLSQVRLIMIGIRNPESKDAKPFSVCMWANELRLTDFERTTGWAANASLNVQLADLGKVSGAIRHTSFGYGNVQSKISERERGTTTSFDLSANLDLGKMLPRKLGLKIPFFASLDRTVINLNYDPANPDLKIDAALRSFETEEEKQAYKTLIRDQITRQSINFTNVKKVKVKPGAKKHVYDIENFSFTYSYSQATQQNFNLKENTKRNIKASIAWQHTFTFKGIEPFKKSKKLSSPYLQLIKDFNFNPLPKSISVRALIDRSFSKLVYRNASSDQQSNVTNFQKFFTFNRYYNVQWNLTKALTLNYNADVNTIIDEPDGDIDTPEKKNIVLGNLKKFGRMKKFNQNITINYKLPLDKLPITDWIAADYRYDVGYDWIAGPLENDITLQLGNTISNKRNQNLTGKINLVSLYNKMDFLKQANTMQRTTDKKTSPTSAKDATQDAPPPDLAFLKMLARIVMSVRSINATYTLTESTKLPGFIPAPFLFGLDNNWTAPGWQFILGDQDFNFRFKAKDNNWLSQNEKLTSLYAQSRTQDINIQASVVPWSGLTIQLSAQKTTTSSFQEIFRFDKQQNEFVSLGPNRFGGYEISTLAIATAFKNNTSLSSSVFQQFERNLKSISTRFNALTNKEYKTQSQDVLIPAFIAAYTDRDVNTINLSPFLKIPLPGWHINYSGLAGIPGLKEIFQNVTISHAYTSNYTVVQYSNSLEYENVGFNTPIDQYNNNFFSSASNASGNLIPVYVVNQVVISEAFAPLIGINLRTKNNLSIRFEYKTKRDLALNISNAQITEVNNRGWLVEIGYTKKNMKLPWRKKGSVVTLKNDITFRINVNVINNRIIQRRIDDVHTVTNGNINFRLRPSINYTISKKLTLQAYVDHNTNEPLVTNSYKRATTRFGIKVLFNLSQ